MAETTEKSIEKQKIKAIILVVGRDFGRCPLASRLPTALWPVAGKPVLERLLDHLANQGIRRAAICSDTNGASIAEFVHADSRLELTVLDESLPGGTAGCIRDAARYEQQTDTLILALHASMTCPPSIDALIKAHRDSQADLTVFFNPPAPDSNNTLGEAADINVCDVSFLEHIRRPGYCDIKEGVIPEMLSAGKTVAAHTLPNHVSNFRDRRGYLRAIASFLQNCPELSRDFRLIKRTSSQALWIGANTSIDASARFRGTVAILDGACICENVLILGPTVIGRNVNIGQGSVVINSVLWDNAKIGPHCQIQRCIVDYHAAVPRNTIAEDQGIGYRVQGIGYRVQKLYAERCTLNAVRWVKKHRARIMPIVAFGLILIAFLWSYWPDLAELWNVWQRSDEYSSGVLVPFLALYILWLRRDQIGQSPIVPCLWGVCAFVAAQAIRLFGLAFMFSSAENASIALSIAALVLILFGWQAFRKVFTIWLFLCLMLPWPVRVQAAVTLPLQRWATTSAVFCLETIGYNVVQEGNIIHIGSASVAVAEACNGLRMVTAFFVISGLVVLLVQRARWEKLIVLASSLPIALLCNTTRLTITALLFTVVSGDYWEKLLHDFGGYAMMPLALAIVVAELWILARLTIPPKQKEQDLIITRQK